MAEVVYFVKFLAALFAIVNPLGAVPIFISLAQGRDAAEVSAIPRRTAVATASILTVAALAGERVLRFFGVGIPAFRVGGGILVLLIAIAMLRARQPRTKHTPEEAHESAEKEDVAVVPLAIPLLAGPGAISTVILNAQAASGIGEELIIIGTVLLVSGCTFALFKLGTPLMRRLGRTGINIFTRIMGLILAAVAVEFITGGLAEIFPALKMVR